jgi:hypothetical protein
MPVILAAQKAEIRKITVQRACLARVRSQVQTPGTTKKINKIKHLARCWWLTPVILAAQEDHGSKPAWQKVLRDPISKKPFTSKGWWKVSRCRP